jgi:hypothetical protein
MDIAPHDTPDDFSRALGQAIIKMWGQLPHDVQFHLFEQTVASQGERLRPQLAIFLHGCHPRTAATIRARAIPEPDSLGG